MSGGEPRGYHRRKDPAAVCQAILQAAGALAAEIGVQALTLQKVADLAGVTKGGMMHHFPSKEALLTALRAEALRGFTEEIERKRREGRGGFTRAYVESCLAPIEREAARVVAALWADPRLRADWYDWLAAQEARHAASDGGMDLKMIRLAADGAWLAMADGQDASHWRAALIEALDRALRRGGRARLRGWSRRGRAVRPASPAPAYGARPCGQS